MPFYVRSAVTFHENPGIPGTIYFRNPPIFYPEVRFNTLRLAAGRFIFILSCIVPSNRLICRT